jgi:hypothetical protein
MANPLFDQTKLPPLFPRRFDFATALAPSDTAAVAIQPSGGYAAALYIGVAGNLTVIMAGDQSNGGLGTPVLLTAVPVGVLDIQVRAVMATGTTASGIVGLR